MSETAQSTTIGPEPVQSGLPASPTGTSAARPARETPCHGLDRIMLKICMFCFLLMGTIMLLDLLSGLWVR